MPVLKERRWLVPEVIQTSEMDCGPAALKCLLEGHHVAASYGRLREACQTGVDGTSIDTLEEIAIALGLNATQTMLPPDHVLLPEASFFPCIAVIQAGLGLTHFVVAWRRVGPWIQVSDPSSGRQWIPVGRFVGMLYAHQQTLAADAYLEWAGDEMNRTLQLARLRQLGVTDIEVPNNAWQALATLDAAIRVTQRLIDAKAIEIGDQASRTVRNFIAHPEAIPESAWAICDAGDDENIIFEGAVFLHVAGLREGGPVQEALTPELAAALSEPPSRPLHELLQLVREGSGIWLAGSLTLAAMLTGAAVLAQGYLLNRFAKDGGGERLILLAAVAITLLLQLPQAFGWLALGRRLELAFRRRFLRKIPKLGDAYFRSRPRSDMADRSHALYRLRNLPPFFGRMLRTSAELLLTACGILWLAPSAVVPVLLLLVSAFALPWLMKPVVLEQDLRMRIQFGAMTRYYLDAMLGLFAIRAHGATRIIRRAHSELTDSWATTAFAYQKTLIAAEGVQLLVSYAITIWIIAAHHHQDPMQLALVAYWTLATPALAAALLQSIWQYPGHRNVTLRALEPLGALEEAMSTALPAKGGGIEIAFDNVAVRVAGHTILEDLNLHIRAGEHIAIVGHSGAGKSSLAGLLLGWHKPSAGLLKLDGIAYPQGAPAALRKQIAWVDPEVHLWDASCLENISYGSEDAAAARDAYAEAELQTVVDLAAGVGPQGARLSGGQGQRIRFARAWMRADARLVILDEAFRGLDSETRASMLQKARQRWPDATLLMITHDTEAAAALDRVLVVDGGRVVESGGPQELLANVESKFREMREVELRNRRAFDDWRGLRLVNGRLEERGVRS